MTYGYKNAQLHLIDRSRVFQNVFVPGTPPTWLVLHKTGGTPDLPSLANWFATGAPMVSTHYGVGQNGEVWQFVDELDGAGGNCCTEVGHASFLPDADGKAVNLNLHTISVEHIDPSTDNSTPLTDAQKGASFALILDICKRNNIPMRPGDENGGVITHSQIAPLSRARCPGNYPLTELWKTFLDVSGMISPGFPQAANDTWHALSSSIPTGTGIYKAWLNAYQKGNQLGPPVSPEQHTVDWGANPIIVQYFLYARCEWQNGQARFFDGKGEIMIN